MIDFEIRDNDVLICIESLSISCKKKKKKKIQNEISI